MSQSSVFQFKITLQDIKPDIWRRIQIAETSSFWDLHVAIQDAMGWLDCHLHHFAVIDPETNEKQWLGIPDDSGFDEGQTLPDWEHKVIDYITHNNQILYLYDYGDSWYHLIEYEGVHEKQAKKKYPVCIDGKRACPPEDVGSISGYYDFVKAINDPKHKEHDSMLLWIGGKYDSEEFDPKKIKFHNSKVRWAHVFP